jgi:hypothetical protein
MKIDRMKIDKMKIDSMKKMAFFSLVFLAVSSLAWASDMSCPVSIPAKQELQAPADWEAVGGSSDVRLERVAFYLKHPSLGGSLVPDATRRSKGEERESWTFVSNPGDEFWMGCVYQDTTVILARKLDKAISKCVVSYELLPSGTRLRVKQVTCD